MSYSKPSQVIFIGFIIITLLVSLFAFMVLRKNTELAELNNQMYLHPFSVSNAALEANNDIHGMYRYMKDVVLATNKDELDLAISLVEQHEQSIHQHFKLINDRFLGDKKTIITAYKSFVDSKLIRTEIFDLKRNQQHRLAAAVSREKGATHFELLTSNMNLLIDFARNKALEFKVNSQNSYETSKSYLYSLFMFVILSAIMTTVLVILMVRKSEYSLNKSEERYALAMAGSKDGLWDWNVLTGEVIYSPHWKSMLGYTEGEISNDLAEGVKRLHPDDIDSVLSHNADFMARKTEQFNCEFRMQHKNGLYINILSRAGAIEDKKGNIIRLVGTHVDITKRKQSEEKLKFAASVFTHVGESIIITDSTGSIIDVNNSCTATTGYSREEMIGQNPRILQSGRQLPEFYVDMWQSLLEKGYWQGELWNRRKNGEVYAEMKAINAVHDERGVITHYVALGNDITQAKQYQEQLEHIARYDILTNLPNRSLLADRLSQSMLQCRRREQSLAVAFLDLDGFKAINDTYGHGVGDELLIALSLRMKEALREGDTLARIGGDEFVAVLVDLVKAEDCLPVLERLLLATSEPVPVGELILNISTSIGVALYPQDDAGADQLIRHADQAMYTAKESGKNCYRLFDTDQDKAVKAQRESLEAIRTALDKQQFVLHYQPKVNMRTGKVTGTEALIRWQHPERGLLSPIEFLPIIENNPMSIELGEWVIDTVLTQISQWQEAGLNLPRNSVNIAAIQIQQTDFTDRLAALLTAHPNVDPRHLELEILETSAIDNLIHVSSTMDACIALGVSFALDDFGTGYSSLTYLKHLPACLIKIDQSFVRDMLVDTDDLAIVDGIIGLAKSFKLDVIAEGVETIEPGTVLLQQGCELA
ncbi:MAG: EAL domain-containing protein, partial [Amphritea sp.]|nr:EAL domain-containing protein [Amphritea sp.]